MYPLKAWGGVEDIRLIYVILCYMNVYSSSVIRVFIGTYVKHDFVLLTK